MAFTAVFPGFTALPIITEITDPKPAEKTYFYAQVSEMAIFSDKSQKS